VTHAIVLIEAERGAMPELGGARTHTMVAFEVFSKHDLEALFSIGG
jgi:hypothetical protein